MKNVFFPDENVTPDDLYFVCYMKERVARQLKQPNRYVVNRMGRRALAEKLSVANVLHCENPLALAADWTDEFMLEQGEYDVTRVNPELVDEIPTALQMGKVYARLILATLMPEEDYPDAIIRVYNNPICEIIDDYNGSAYYEPSYYIAKAYYQGNFN